MLARFIHYHGTLRKHSRKLRDVLGGLHFVNGLDIIHVSHGIEGPRLSEASLPSVAHYQMDTAGFLQLIAPLEKKLIAPCFTAMNTKAVGNSGCLCLHDSGKLILHISTDAAEEAPLHFKHSHCRGRCLVFSDVLYDSQRAFYSGNLKHKPPPFICPLHVMKEYISTSGPCTFSVVGLEEAQSQCSEFIAPSNTEAVISTPRKVAPTEYGAIVAELQVIEACVAQIGTEGVTDSFGDLKSSILNFSSTSVYSYSSLFSSGSKVCDSIVMPMLTSLHPSIESSLLPDPLSAVADGTSGSVYFIIRTSASVPFKLGTGAVPTTESNCAYTIVHARGDRVDGTSTCEHDAMWNVLFLEF